MRTQAGLTKDDVAERMGISPPEITRLEDHALCANADTLQRYAQACGVKLKLSFS
ncbi:helix-turn-helix transcriptional regulator [Cronobacter turicensis]|nr:helix-turn-helix transcriptional regulator [Cronobacter turicensis]ELY4303067.1 helix-turn-helix transcriptional regulator [Cronobacter turicensis]ELY6322167.1 helix-turn-helix transcriptional regulator [Cronobacter turicensis]